LSLTLEIADVRWRKARGLSARLKRAVVAALKAAGADEDRDLTLLMASDRRVKALNREFRGFDKPTNVLSFPSAEEDYLGDIAIAYGVTAKEAKAAGKTLADHAVHLAVHGVLHLLGYDHVTPRMAKVMEPLEVAILKSLGVADPYETR
jgi:probable rRNA maturation factor